MFLFIVRSVWYCLCLFFFFQAEDGIRDLVRSRGLGDVYKRQGIGGLKTFEEEVSYFAKGDGTPRFNPFFIPKMISCLLYTSDAADERSSVDLGGRRIIKKKKHKRKDSLGR